MSGSVVELRNVVRTYLRGGLSGLADHWRPAWRLSLGSSCGVGLIKE